MKLDSSNRFVLLLLPAAFGRLCVETVYAYKCKLLRKPAAFGRLCVETGKKG